MMEISGLSSASTRAQDTEKDAALAVVSDVAIEVDPVIAKRVLRKIDLYFMPAMLIGTRTILFVQLINLAANKRDHIRIWHSLL